MRRACPATTPKPISPTGEPQLPADRSQCRNTAGRAASGAGRPRHREPKGEESGQVPLDDGYCRVDKDQPFRNWCCQSLMGELGMVRPWARSNRCLVFSCHQRVTVYRPEVNFRCPLPGLGWKVAEATCREEQSGVVGQGLRRWRALVRRSLPARSRSLSPRIPAACSSCWLRRAASYRTGFLRTVPLRSTRVPTVCSGSSEPAKAIPRCPRASTYSAQDRATPSSPPG